MIKAASLFSQLLHVFPRSRFEAVVRKHDGNYAAKGFDCWTQLVSMLFCQLARADSLREICQGLACCVGKLVHLGVARAPTNQPCPMPTPSLRRRCMKSCSGRRSIT